MIAVKWDNSQQTIIRLDYAAPVADWMNMIMQWKSVTRW